MKARGVLCALIVLLGSGCATRYGSQSNVLTGWMGGYTDRPGPGELVRVDFAGNGFIDSSKVGIYLVYRCAELAQAHGKPYFSMYPTLAHAIADRAIGESSVTSVGGKPLGTIYVLYQDTDVPGATATKDVLDRYEAVVKEEPKA